MEQKEKQVPATGWDRWLAVVDGVLGRSLASSAAAVLLGCFLSLTAAVLLFKLGAAPVSRSSEGRVFAVSSTMVESGNWLVPYFEGAPRLQKPPLYYWATALLSVPSGAVSHWSLRLTSVVSALLLLLVVYRWGRALSGPGLGILAMLLMLGTGQFWLNGRRGDAEMLLALCCTAALFIFDQMRATRDRKLLPWFALVCALAFLTKATVAILIIGLPIVLQLTLHREWRSVWHPAILGWMLLSLLACLAWYVVILVRVPDALALFKSALLIPVGNHAGESDSTHYRPFYFYFRELPGAYTALLLGLPLLWLQRRAQWLSPSPRVRFVAVSAVALFVTFSLIPAKQRHYLLPLLPLLALALADGIIRLAHDAPERCARWLRRAGPVLLGLGSLLALGRAGYLAVLMHENVLCWASVLVLGIALAVAAHHSLRRARFYAATGILAALVLFIGAPLFLDFDLWHARFKENVAAQAPDFHAHGWQRFFDTFPPARKMLGAEGWREAASPAAADLGASAE